MAYDVLSTNLHPQVLLMKPRVLLQIQAPTWNVAFCCFLRWLVYACDFFTVSIALMKEAASEVMTISIGQIIPMSKVSAANIYQYSWFHINIWGCRRSILTVNAWLKTRLNLRDYDIIPMFVFLAMEFFRRHLSISPLSSQIRTFGRSKINWILRIWNILAVQQNLKFTSPTISILLT